MKRLTSSGFTLIEVLIVAAILVILAGIAVPAFDLTVDDARVTSASQELQRLRTGVDYYMFHHLEQAPGFDPGTASWTQDAFVNQLTTATDQSGDWAAVGTAGFPYGPYLTEGIPTNPFNGLLTVMVIAPGGSTAGLPNDATGWVFIADGNLLRINSTENDTDGDPVWNL